MTSSQEALRTGSLEALLSIPKSDLHNNTFGGGNRAWIAFDAGELELIRSAGLTDPVR